MPQLVQKFYAVKDKNTIKRGMIVSTLFAVIIGGVAYFVGATGRVFLNPQNAPTVFDAGKPIFDRLMPELLTNVIPASLSILMLLLILSASMSTLAALVLISGSTLAQDVYAGYFDPKISDRKLTLLMRCMSAFFVLLSVILALFNIETIVTVMGVSWGAIGSTFLGPFVWGLLNKKVNKVGAISSSVLGLSTCLLLYYAGNMSSPEAGTIGMLVSLAVNPVVSFIYSAIKRDA
jgi:Na+/pantothenate symporter